MLEKGAELGSRKYLVMCLDIKEEYRRKGRDKMLCEGRVDGFGGFIGVGAGRKHKE